MRQTSILTRMREDQRIDGGSQIAVAQSNLPSSLNIGSNSSVHNYTLYGNSFEAFCETYVEKRPFAWVKVADLREAYKGYCRKKDLPEVDDETIGRTLMSKLKARSNKIGYSELPTFVWENIVLKE